MDMRGRVLMAAGHASVCARCRYKLFLGPVPLRSLRMQTNFSRAYNEDDEDDLLPHELVVRAQLQRAPAPRPPPPPASCATPRAPIEQTTPPRSSSIAKHAVLTPLLDRQSPSRPVFRSDPQRQEPPQRNASKQTLPQQKPHEKVPLWKVQRHSPQNARLGQVEAQPSLVDTVSRNFWGQESASRVAQTDAGEDDDDSLPLEIAARSRLATQAMPSHSTGATRMGSASWDANHGLSPREQAAKQRAWLASQTRPSPRITRATWAGIKHGDPKTSDSMAMERRKFTRRPGSASHINWRGSAGESEDRNKLDFWRHAQERTVMESDSWKGFQGTVSETSPSKEEPRKDAALGWVDDIVSPPVTRNAKRLDQDEAGGRQERGVGDGDAWIGKEMDALDRTNDTESRVRARDRDDQAVGERGNRDAYRRSRRREGGREDEETDVDEHVLEDRRRRKAQKKAEKERPRQMEVGQGQAKPMILPQHISVRNLASALGLKVQPFVKQLEEFGFGNINEESVMTGETAALVAQEYGFEPTVDVGEAEDVQPRPPPEDVSALPPRPPVVTIMGHVDHGKTSLLDYLRKSSIVAEEHGGITQHIGAFSVRLSSGRTITFLDTPGHAAFLSMRQRGANVTDMVVLVVAADESVKPQTLEALRHVRLARVPMIVAISKVDKEEADIDRVKLDLARNSVEIEDYGGDVQVVPVSGQTGQGMGDLEESIVLLSDILDIRAETDGMVEGWILEAAIKPIGRVATVLVKRATLRKGDNLVAGKVWAKARVLLDEAGQEVPEALPGTAVEVLGWKDLPDAGDQVLTAPDEGRAKAAARYRRNMQERGDALAQWLKQEEASREAEAAEKEAKSKQDMADTGEKDTKLVNLVVKADVYGSVEAVCAAIAEIGSNEVRPSILWSGPGQIVESDIAYAATTGALIINFNNPIAGHIKGLARAAGVEIHDHTIIYHLAKDVRDTLSRLLPPRLVTKVVGEAEILQIFKYNIKSRLHINVAGCKVRNGVVSRNSKYRVLRNGRTVFDGALNALKHVKKDVTEMRKGSECGMSFLDWDDMKIGDQIQAYEEHFEKRHL